MSNATTREGYPIHLVMLVLYTVVAPTMFAAIPFVAAGASEWVRANVPAIVVLSPPALVLAVRVALLAYTLIFDSRLELRDDALHVPVLSPWQLRPWDLRYEDMAKVEYGSGTRERNQIAVVTRSGARILIASSPLQGSPFAIVAAIAARIPRPPPPGPQAERRREVKLKKHKARRGRRRG